MTSEKKIEDVKDDSNVARIFWTGGFDSTALLIRLLKQKKKVIPIYIKHSRNSGWMKGEREDRARTEIRKQLRSSWKKYLDKEVIWDHDQFSMNYNYNLLFEAYVELCNAVGIGEQYAVLRALRDWVGYEGSKIQMAIVMFDQLWWNLRSIGSDVAGWKFFKDFEFPMWYEEKITIWKKSSKYEKSLLNLTFSCEIEKGNKTCIERGLSFGKRCKPCQGRLDIISK